MIPGETDSDTKVYQNIQQLLFKILEIWYFHFLWAFRCSQDDISVPPLKFITSESLQNYKRGAKNINFTNVSLISYLNIRIYTSILLLVAGNSKGSSTPGKPRTDPTLKCPDKVHKSDDDK